MSSNTQVADSTGALAPGNAGTAFLKLSAENGLALLGFSSRTFRSHAPAITFNATGAGSALVVPDLPDSSGVALHVVLGTDNAGRIYVLNRDAIGNKTAQSSAISQIVSPEDVSSGVSSALAYFGNGVFQAASGATIKAFALTDGAISTVAVGQSSTPLGCCRRTDFDISKRSKRWSPVGRRGWRWNSSRL